MNADINNYLKNLTDKCIFLGDLIPKIYGFLAVNYPKIIMLKIVILPSKKQENYPNEKSILSENLQYE
jgi:hypothetical protein